MEVKIQYLKINGSIPILESTPNVGGIAVSHEEDIRDLLGHLDCQRVTTILIPSLVRAGLLVPSSERYASTITFKELRQLT
jgi:hypothetical protein